MFQIKEWISCISSNVSFVVPTLASLRLEGAGLSLEDKARVIWDIRRKAIYKLIFGNWLFNKSSIRTTWDREYRMMGVGREDRIWWVTLLRRCNLGRD